jgi:hypothetical protein
MSTTSSKPLSRSDCRRGPATDLVRRLLAEAAGETGASEATLWLLSEDEAYLEGTANHGPTPAILEQARVPVTGSVVGLVASNGLAASIGPEDYHNPEIDRLTGVQTGAMIAVPVYVRGKLRGVISAINPKGGSLFAAADLERLSWKAYLAGLVLADQCA